MTVSKRPVLSENQVANVWMFVFGLPWAAGFIYFFALASPPWIWIVLVILGMVGGRVCGVVFWRWVVLPGQLERQKAAELHESAPSDPNHPNG